MFTKGSFSELRPNLEAIGAGVAIIDGDKGKGYEIIATNELFASFSERSPSDSVNIPLREIFPRHISRILMKGVSECLDEVIPVECEVVKEKMAETQWWHVVLSPIMDANRKVIRCFITCIDVSMQMELENSLSLQRTRFQALIQNSYDGIISINEEQTIELINPAACEMFLVESQDVIGAPIESLVPMRYRDKHKAYVDGFKHSPVKSRPMHERGAVTGRRSDGTEFPLEITISKIRVGERLELTAVIRDISERARLMDTLEHKALNDPLTDLPNRRQFDSVMEKEVARARRFQHDLSLIMMDIDHFKKINDSYGHPSGDQVLKYIASVLKGAVREVDCAARIGGEEFAVILPESNGILAEEAARRIQAKIKEQPFSFDNGETIGVTLSFGVSELHDDDDSPAVLIARSDKALYRSKEGGRDRVTGPASA